MNWIDINDRLPEMTEGYDEVAEKTIVASNPVLVSIGGESVKYGRFEKEDDRIYFLNAPIIYDAFGEYEYELDEISHWMPLPAPAKLSHEYWFKRALVEGVNNHFQRIIDSDEK